MNRRNLGELLGSITLADIVNPRMAGFALTRAWAYIMFFSTVIHYSTRNDLTHLNSTVTWAALGASCIMVAAALFARPFYTRFLTRRWLPAALAILLLSLMVLLVLIDIINEEWFQQPWCSMFCFTAGVGLGILYLGWGGTYADSNEAKVAVEVTASFLFAALLFAAVVALPRTIGIAATMVILVLGIRLLFHTQGAWKRQSLLAPVRLSKSRFMARALASAGILGFTESCVQELFVDMSPVLGVDYYCLVLPVAALIATAIMGVTLFTPRDSSEYPFAYRVVLFTMALIYLLLPIVDRGTFFADVLALTAYCLVSMLVWIVLVRTESRYHLSPLVVFGFGWGLMTAGSLCGTWVGGFMLSFIEMTPRLLSVIALISTCLLLFAYFFLFNERSVMELTSERGADGEVRPFRNRCEEVARQYKLSAKETEVMILVAKGRSTPRICEELDISQGTANTHLTHIYKKMDVHDRQQLIDVLEGR